MNGASVASVMFGLAGFGLFAVTVEVAALFIIRKRKVPPLKTFPSVSILKPLCGLDDRLLENLESHLRIQYPGKVEILLGLRSPKDPAYALAKTFATEHADRVRVVLQEGEPGHNPKVNQLITLTRASQNDIIVVTDSNVRVEPKYLLEIVASLQQPGVGLATNLFVGDGERWMGAILDNMTLISFCAGNLALGDLVLPNDQVVGKSLALRRETLEQLGGWHEYKDVLAEDQLMGRNLRKYGWRAQLCPTPVRNIQVHHPLSSFWKRHTRWSMMRFRVLFPGNLFEPLLNPLIWAIAGTAAVPSQVKSWWMLLGTAAGSTLLTELAARIARGHGFRPWHWPLVPVRDVLFFLIWLRSMTLRSVDWRGNQLRVLAGSRLAEPEALVRVKSMQKARAHSPKGPSSRAA